MPRLKQEVKLINPTKLPTTDDTGQHYELVRVDNYVTKAGRFLKLATVRSRCADCGALFGFKVPYRSKRISVNRRCDKHKRPGAPGQQKDRPKAVKLGGIFD